MIRNEKEAITFITKFPNIIIYGAGMVGELVAKRIEDNLLKDRILCFAVSQNQKTADEIRGIPIEEIQTLQQYAENSVVVIATLPDLHNILLTNAQNLGFKNIVLIHDKLYENMCRNYIKTSHVGHIPKQNKGLRILFIASDNNSSSGAFLCMLDLCEELNKKGMQVLVLLPQYGNGEEVLQEKNINYRYVRSYDWAVPVERSRDLGIRIQKVIQFVTNNSAVSLIRQIIKQEEIDIVHINTTYSYVGALAAKKEKVPYIWHLREYMPIQGNAFFSTRHAYRLMNQSSAIISISMYIQKRFEKLQQDRVSVIYDGIDIRHFRIFEKKILMQPKIIILMVGAITPYKGQLELILAADELCKKNISNFEVWLVGKGPKEYISELQREVEIRKLKEIVTFWGRQNNVMEYYDKADIVVVCSREEPFGRVTVEGMLSGNLIIGANTGATPELIEDGVSGLLYQYGNSSHLSEQIMQAISYKERSQKMADEGRKYAFSGFSKERNAEEIIQVYKNIIKNGKVRG